jgi:hypothetical protein
MNDPMVAARAVLGAPGIENVGGRIHLMVPIMNIGEAALPGLEVRAITLGTAVRASPPAFPIVPGTLGAGHVATVAARFDAAGLAVGARYLLSVTASYLQGRQAFAMTLNRYVQIPAPAQAAVPALRARVVTTVAPNTWQYTLHNDEPAGSGLNLCALALAVQAPVTITGTPPGWHGETDGISQVLWRALDPLPPYPNHVAPGRALAGFQLSSPRVASLASGAAVSSWQTAGDMAGPVYADYVLTPYTN